MTEISAASTQNAYTITQLRQYLDIIDTSKRRDEVEKKLEALGFMIYINTNNVRSLLEEADKSLAVIKDIMPHEYERIQKQMAAAQKKRGSKPDSFIGSRDCPC